MGHIFISYSHKDSSYIHKLVDALEEEGFEVWIDDRIHYGSEWPKVVTRNLDVSDGVIIVMSNNSFESDMVQNEITRAREKKKPIFPLLLEGDNWLIVQAKQFVDVRDESIPTEKFYKRLEEITQRKNQKAEREAAEKIAREKEEQEAKEKARLEAEEQARQKIAREKAEREAAEKLAQEKARLEAEELARQKAAKEKAERESAEKLAQEKTAREKAEKDAKERAEREAAEKAAQEKARLEAEEQARQKAAREKAEREKKEREADEKPKPKAVKPTPVEEKPAKVPQAKPNQPHPVQQKSGAQIAFWAVGFIAVIFIIGLLASNNGNKSPSSSIPTSTQAIAPATSVSPTRKVVPSITPTQFVAVSPKPAFTETSTVNTTISDSSRKLYLFRKIII